MIRSLEARAIRLAQTHACERGRPTPIASLEALNEIRNFMQRAHGQLTATGMPDLDSEKAAEWFLDNYYVVQRAIGQIQRDMPLGFYHRLPRLSDGHGLPRVFVVAQEFVGATDYRFDLVELDGFVSAYQTRTSLNTAELWALPTMLRLALLETLTLSLSHITTVVVPDHLLVTTELTVSPLEAIARCLRDLMSLATIKWDEFFERHSLVDSVLQKDPANAYGSMDFETRDRYRDVVETVAWRAGRDELEVAEQVVRLASRGETGSRSSHVGFYLVDSGIATLETTLGFRFSPAVRVRNWSLRHPTWIYFAAIVAATAAVMVGPVLALDQLRASVWLTVMASLLFLNPASMFAVAFVQWGLTLVLKPRVLPKMDFSEKIPRDCRTVVVIPTLLGSFAEVHSLIKRIELHYLANTDPALSFAILADFADASAKQTAQDTELADRAEQGIRLLNRMHEKDGREPFHLLVRERRWNQSEGVWMGWERKRGKLEEFNRLLGGATDTSYALHVGSDEELKGVRFVITLDTDTELPRTTAASLVGIMAHPLNQAVFDRERQRVVAGYTVVQPRTNVSPNGANATFFARTYSGDTTIDIYSRAVSDVYQDFFGAGTYVGKGIYDVKAFRRSLEGCVPENTLLSHDLLEGIHGRVGLATDVVVYEDYPAHYLGYVRRLHRWVRGDWQLLPWLRLKVPDAVKKRVRRRFSIIDRWKLHDNLRRSLHPLSVVSLLLAGWLVLPGPPWIWTMFTLGLTSSSVVIAAASALARTVRGPWSPRGLRGIWADTPSVVVRWILFVAFLPHESVVVLDAIARTLVRVVWTRRHLLQWQTALHTAHRLERSRRGLIFFEMALGPILAVTTGCVVWIWRPGAIFFALPILAAWLVSPLIAHRISQPVREQKELLPATDRARLRRLARRTWLFFESFVGPEDQWLPPDNVQDLPEGRIAHRTSPTNIGMYLLSVVSSYDLGFVGISDLLARLRSTFATLQRMERHEGHLFNWYDTRTLEPLLPKYVSTVDSGNLAASLLTVAQGCGEIATASLVPAQRWSSLLDLVVIIEQALASCDEPFFQEWSGLLDTSLKELTRDLQEVADAPERWSVVAQHGCQTGLVAFEKNLVALVGDPKAAPGIRVIHEVHDWTLCLRRQLDSIRRDIDFVMPWLPLLDKSPPCLARAEGDLGDAWRTLRSCLRPVTNLNALSDVCAHTRSAVEDLATRGATLETGSRNELATWLESMRQALTNSEANARRWLEELLEMGARAESDSERMNFAMLYDRRVHQFFLGYDVSAARIDEHHYDLLASEARLTSLVAVAEGQVPVEHWFHMGRPVARLHKELGLLSWSGTLFEYLMPELLVRSYERTLLSRSCRGAIDKQISHGRRHGVPWGISESAFNLRDSHDTYQYRAFGVPGLGLRRDVGEELVIAPYASMLALSIRPRAVANNLRRFEQAGMVAQYGLFEAIDYTPKRVLSGKEHAIVNSMMAHHQGMILVAINNLLNEQAMPRRFSANTTIQTALILLSERVPTSSVLEDLPESDATHPRLVANDGPTTCDPWPMGSTGFPVAHVVSNGSLSTVVTDSGGGGMWQQSMNVTPWTADSTLDQTGHWLYLRDEESGAVWSATPNPIGAGEAVETTCWPHKVEFHSRHQGISCRLEITIVPEQDVEIRRVTLTNESTQSRSLRLATFSEIALSPTGERARHPAFDKLFLRSEILNEPPGLLTSRRPRAPTDSDSWLLYRMVDSDPGVESVAYVSDRGSFIGRCRSVCSPQALMAPERQPSGRHGYTLEPALASVASVTLANRQVVRVALVTSVAASRKKAQRAGERYATMDAVDVAFEDAERACRRELAAFHIDGKTLQQFQVLLSALLIPNPEFREQQTERISQARLWKWGVSGEHPILLVRVHDADETTLLSQLMRAQRFWRSQHVTIDLVLLVDAQAGYLDAASAKIDDMLRKHDREYWKGRAGGVFVVHTSQLSSDELRRLPGTARIVLDAGRSLAAQLAERRPCAQPLPDFTPTAQDEPESPTEDIERLSDLLFDNGLGGFTRDGREYVIQLRAGQTTPAPWSNVLANPSFGCLVSESGLGSSWAVNASQNRLTPWSNDPVCDPPSEAIYVRDEATGVVWSPTPLPAPAPMSYRIHHGAGYTIFHHNSHGLAHQTEVFVDKSDPVKVIRVKLRNLWNKPRRLTLTYYAEWILGTTRSESQTHVIPEFDSSTEALLAHNPWNTDFAERVAFVAVSRRVHGFTTDRTEFLGRHGAHDSPAALRRWGLNGTIDTSCDSCAAIQVHIELEPGQETQIHFLLGQGKDREQALALARCYKDPSNAEHARQQIVKQWDDMLGKIECTTPDPAMNVMLNRWLLYQAVASRLWGRTGFYQSSGAIGFRDQLQDCMATCFVAPEIARRQILEAAAHQFEDGDVLHWWHPPSDHGVRTRCSDDMLWLPFVVAHYVRSTGDREVLGEKVPFLIAAPLAEDENDRYAQYESSSEAHSVWEHCRRAIDRAITSGVHGLPLFGTGDWNDGMNRVGAGGRGESIWLGWFACKCLTEFADLCEKTAQPHEAAACRARAETLRRAIEASGWDGNWYLRGFYDDGTALGASDQAECCIDSVAQSWAVLSGMGDPTRSRASLVQAKKLLVTEHVARLLWPPFDDGPKDPGYIKAYPPGVRENGAQYTHAATWLAWAFRDVGDGDTAANLFRLLNPIEHASSARSVERYRVEPYVVAGDVCGMSPYVGRGGWTWYTGSAAWLWRLGVEAILGVSFSGTTLTINPCIPQHWEFYQVTVRHGGSVYRVRVENPDHVSRGIAQLIVDGRETPLIVNDRETPRASIALGSESAVHDVIVRLGPTVVAQHEDVKTTAKG